jgi:hypothetical protein
MVFVTLCVSNAENGQKVNVQVNPLDTKDHPDLGLCNASDLGSFRFGPNVCLTLTLCVSNICLTPCLTG